MDTDAGQNKPAIGSGASFRSELAGCLCAIVSKLGGDADNSTRVFTEPKAGYWMPRGEASQEGTE